MGNLNEKRAPFAFSYKSDTSSGYKRVGHNVIPSKGPCGEKKRDKWLV